MLLRQAPWRRPLDGSHGGTARATTSRNMERADDKGCECCLSQTAIKWPDSRVSSQTHEILPHRSRSIRTHRVIASATQHIGHHGSNLRSELKFGFGRNARG